MSTKNLGNTKRSREAEAISNFIERVSVESRTELYPASDDKTLRTAIIHGLRSGELQPIDSTLILRDDASAQYVAHLASALHLPIILSPTVGPALVSDTTSFQSKAGQAMRQFLKELAAATEAINKKYTQVSPLLGEPLTGVEFSERDTQVAYRKYRSGAIYVPPGGRAPVEVHGAIYQKYLALGAENSFLGFPETDSLTSTSPDGTFNHFNGGSIYWSSRTGAWSVERVMRDRWWTIGGTSAYLGFPISDVENGSVLYFERGRLRLDSDGSLQDSPDSLILSTSVNGGDVKCSTEIWMNSKGDWHYTGHLHNDGFAGCTVSVATTPRFQSADDHVFVLVAERSLGGTMDNEDRNDDWEQSGNDDFIRDNWDIIRFAGANVMLKTNTQIGDVLNILWPVVAAAAIIFGTSSSNVKVCGPYGSVKRDYSGNDVTTVSWDLVGSDEQCRKQ